MSKHPDYRVAALVDKLPAAAEIVADHEGLVGVPIYTDTTEALDAVACDAVVIATPDGQHTQPTLATLARGRHVYVEKPMAITLEDCAAIVAADRAAGGRVMVGFNLRFAPLYRRLHDMIGQGAVGRLLTIQADEFYIGGRTYFRRYNRLRRDSGGLWITKASHDFDLLYWMAGRLPVRVSAAARLTHCVPKPEAGTHCSECPVEPECDDSHLRVRIERSEIAAKLQAARRAAGLPPADVCIYNSDKDTFDHGIAQVEFEDDVLATYTLNVVSPLTERRMRVGGAEGVIQGSLHSPEVVYHRRRPGEFAHDTERIRLWPEGEPPSSHGGADRLIPGDFAAFVRGQRPSPVSPAEGAVAVAIGAAATQASDSGQAVEMSQMPHWRGVEDVLRSRVAS
jgi:predicted dehydrogenase